MSEEESRKFKEAIKDLPQEMQVQSILTRMKSDLAIEKDFRDSPFSKLSICTMYCDNDKQFVDEFLRYIPKHAELVLCYTKQDLTLKENVFEIKEIKDVDTNHIVLCEYRYQNWSFSEARNNLINQADRDWILSLDADERICWFPNEWNILFADMSIGGYVMWCVSHTNLQFPECAWVLRLFRNHPEIKFKYRVHEQIREAIMKQGMAILYSDIIIKHLGYKTTKKNIIEKHRRNFLLEAMDYFEYGENPRIMRLMLDDLKHMETLGFIPEKNKLFNTNGG